MSGPLRVRWLGRVAYREALDLQRRLCERSTADHLLLLEHDHVFTHGRHADLERNLRCDPADVGAELIAVDRGGDITYHGPGQLTGYPIVSTDGAKGSLDHVRRVEAVVIDALTSLGIDAGRLDGYPGVWVDPEGLRPRKIAAVGVRIVHGRSMHGFNLNLETDMDYLRRHIIACGIDDRPVTSLREEGLDIDMSALVDAVVAVAGRHFGDGRTERQDVAWRRAPEDLTPFSRGAGPGSTSRLSVRAGSAGLGEGIAITERKPEWLRPVVRHGEEVLDLRRRLREHDLVTVCEDAGCPNLSECWAEGTATFMVLGDRCTRACGFCLVDTRRPMEPDVGEPSRVAEAVNEMGLQHAVLTMVARDDLPDGGLAHVARCVTAIRERSPGTAVETLISDAAGDDRSLAHLLAVRPDVLNHNLETVARLQRVVRPSAGYARSLAVLSRAADAGLVTKSGIMLGIGEREAEIEGCLADLASIGVSVVTLGQYLRPTSHHLPVDRWVEPAEFDHWASVGRALGITHLESSPLTRSSHHAGQAARAVDAVPVSLGSRVAGTPA
ncbi:MAG: lipoyl synthase [Ilumatobacter sp.]